MKDYIVFVPDAADRATIIPAKTSWDARKIGAADRGVDPGSVISFPKAMAATLGPKIRKEFPFEI